ncbi:CynX/NimT family MFS transporter [Saccharospirillum impatiens]|uniref:MFS transporter n=1 Tax=Saccharospirillum impatiens TaxID=169438 RepID=UPI00042827AA|nr:MFS transporter [Saccharospirillum impatiens]
MSRTRLPAELIVIVAGVSAALHLGKLPPSIDALEAALGITLLQAGFMLSLVQLAGMTVGLLVGMAADTVGLRRSMITGLGILALASLIGAEATTVPALLSLRAIEGIGFLLVVLPAPGLIRRQVRVDKLSQRLGLWGCYMGFGTSLALLTAPWVIDVTGWQGWWRLLALVSMLMLAWVLFGVPADSRRSTVTSATQRAPWWQRPAITLSSPGPWLIAIIFALYSSQWLSVIGFLPSIYRQAGFSALLIGPLTALVALINVLGNLASGYLLHRGISPSRLLYTGFGFMSAGTFLAYSSLTEGAPLVRYLAVLLFSMVGGVIPGVLFSLAVRLAPSEDTVSTTVGWMQQWSSIGQFAGPPLVALVASRSGGWDHTWVVTGGLSLVAVLVIRRLPRPAL